MSYEKVNYDELIVGREYRIINEWYAYNYMNPCVEIFIGEYVKKFQINENITVVFLVNGYNKYISSVNKFYLIPNTQGKNTV
jgi:hypothetical protein